MAANKGIDDFLEATLRKACELSSQDKIGNVVHKAASLLHELTKKFDNPENLRFSANSLERERLHVEEWDGQREAPIRGLAYSLSEKLESTIKWISNREENRKSICIKKEIADVDEREEDLLNVSEVGDAGLSVKTEISENEIDGSTFDAVPTQGAWSDEEQEIDSNNNKTTKKKPKRIRNYAKVDCRVCGKTFNNNWNLSRHEKSHLDNEQERLPFKCDECGKRFAQKNNFEIHKKVHLDENDPNKAKFECDICGRVFAHQTTLKDHKNIHLSKEKLPFKCDDCGLKFASPSSLAKHKLSAHTHDDDPRKMKRISSFKCEICENVYKWRHSLQSHMRSHEADFQRDAKKHECYICRKQYSSKQFLECHKLTHLSDDDVRKQILKCDICGIFMSSKASLAIHKDTHLADDDPRKQKYKCDICGKFIVRSKQDIARHKQLHLGNSSIKCQTCGKGFADSRSLNRHARNKHSTGTEKRQISRRVPFQKNDEDESSDEEEEGIIGSESDEDGEMSSDKQESIEDEEDNEDEYSTQNKD